MDVKTKVFITKKFNVTDLSGEKVMVDFEKGKYFLIKGAGNNIWELIQDKISVGDIIDSLRKEYEVEEETCKMSVISFLDSLNSAGLITLEDN